MFNTSKKSQKTQVEPSCLQVTR